MLRGTLLPGNYDFGKLHKITGTDKLQQIMADYGRLQCITAFTAFHIFQCVLSCFIAFYRVLSVEMPQNDQKRSETVKSDYESLRKFAKVHESQHSVQAEQKKVKLAKFITRQRSLRASLKHGWVMHGPSAQSGTPLVHCGTHAFCQLDFGKTKVLMAKYAILSSEEAWRM